MTGLVLYWFRDLPARRLAGISAAIILFLSVQHTANHMYSAELGGAVGPSKITVECTSSEQEEVLQDWAEFLDLQFVSVELAEQQLQLMQSGYIDNFLGFIPINFLLQTVGFIGTAFGIF